jgi:hypothetical protein
MTNQPPRLVQSVNVDLPSDLQPTYSNLARITHSPAEMVLDFARFLPGMLSAPILARVILSPTAAKLFFRALGDNIARYEAAYGEIPVPRDSPLANELFRAVQPPDSPPRGNS